MGVLTIFKQALGVSLSTVGMWESGKNDPRANMLPKIANLYGCTVDDLLGDQVVQCLHDEVDDMGRGDARTAIIKGRVFPLRERVSLRDIEDALHGLAAKGCISLYTVGGRSYFWFPTWGKHQRIRDVKPKYPAPEDETALCGGLRRTAA